jgi:hypothetical protein
MTVEDIVNRRVAIDVEIRELDAEKQAHEQAARDLLLKRTELRKEREALSLALESQKVKQVVLQDRQAAATARQQAEQHSADLEKLKAQIAEQLQKLKEKTDGSDAAESS